MNIETFNKAILLNRHIYRLDEALKGLDEEIKKNNTRSFYKLNSDVSRDLESLSSKNANIIKNDYRELHNDFLNSFKSRIESIRDDKIKQFKLL